MLSYKHLLIGSTPTKWLCILYCISKTKYMSFRTIEVKRLIITLVMLSLNNEIEKQPDPSNSFILERAFNDNPDKGTLFNI